MGLHGVVLPAGSREVQHLVIGRGSFAEEANDTEPALSRDPLAFVVHDLRGPLTTIRGYAQLIRRAMRRGDTRQLDDFAGRIEDEIRRMDEALLTALAQSRFKAAALPVRRDATDLVAVMQDIAEAFRWSTGREIDVEAELASLVCEGHEGQLRRALMNVMENAIKYSPPNTVVAIKLWAEAGPTAVISVDDHGIGIPNEEIAKVFQAGYRATNAVGEASGSGLGLPSVRDIVEQHGGRVSLESREGHGTTLTVSLPMPMGEAKSISMPVLAEESFAPTT